MSEGSIRDGAGSHFLPMNQIWSAPKIKFERPLVKKFYFRFQFWHASSYAPLYVWSYKISAKWHTGWWLYPMHHSLTQVPHFYHNGQNADPETPEMAEQYFQLHDGRFWIEKPAFHGKHRSNSLNFGDICVRHSDRQTTWTITLAGPHCGGPAKND